MPRYSIIYYYTGMILNKVEYCRNEIAIKRLQYIMRDTDDTIVSRYIESDGQHTLFFNDRFDTTLLLYKKKDAKNWIALFKTNYTKSSFIYCLLAARVVCRNVHIIVNDVDIASTKSEAKLLNKAGYKLKLISSNMFTAIAKDEFNPIDYIPNNFGSFVIEENNRVPIVIEKKKMIIKMPKQNIH